MKLQATVTSKGQITVPVRLREKLGLHAGDQVVFRELDDGSIVIEPKSHELGDMRGIVQLDQPLKASDLSAMIRDARSTRGRRELETSLGVDRVVEDGR